MYPSDTILAIRSATEYEGNMNYSVITVELISESDC